jgi:hypothetical protein
VATKKAGERRTTSLKAGHDKIEQELYPDLAALRHTAYMKNAIEQTA